jgi:tellurite resistance protein TerA
MDLVKGANMALPAGPVTIRAVWSGLSGAVEDVDLAAFVLTPEGRVTGDAGMVFYGQPASPEGAVKLEGAADAGETRVAIDPSRIPAGIAKVAITATLTAKGHRPFSDVGALKLEVLSGGAVIGTFTVDTAAATEAALILGEVYERGGAWKFRAVGQGFNGGLQPLAENYGVSVASEAPAPEPVKAKAKTPSPAAGKVNLSKISLNKANPTVSLEKKGGTLGEISINLDWNQQTVEKRGLFGMKKAGGIDLDLCCLYELADGTRLGVQALGGNFGQFDGAPYIQLAGDDRTGAVKGGEWMRINGKEWGKIRRVLIFAMIYEGVPNWSATDGKVTLFVPGNPDVEVLLEGTSNERLCAVALLENVNETLRITHENRYFATAPDMDRHFGFELNWTSGRK